MKKYIIPELKLERLNVSNIAAGSPPIKDEDADDSQIYSGLTTTMMMKVNNSHP